jgi:hypothetical protein
VINGGTSNLVTVSREVLTTAFSTSKDPSK